MLKAVPGPARARRHGKPCNIYLKCPCGNIFNSHRLEENLCTSPTSPPAASILSGSMAPFSPLAGSPAEYRAGIERAIAKGWLWRHESGTYVKFTDVGAELFA
jgi:hypothetical protein